MAMGLAVVAAMVIAGVAIFLAIIWFLLPFLDSKQCPGCAAKRPLAEEQCAFCGHALPGPARSHPGAVPYGFPDAAAANARPGVRVEGGAAFNRGITRRVVTLATLAMALGIGLRLLGMAGALGLPQVPTAVDGALTLVGGLVAFVGFVFLDAA